MITLQNYIALWKYDGILGYTNTLYKNTHKPSELLKQLKLIDKI